MLVVALLVIASVMGLAATDLVLPAIPDLPAALGGTPTEAQYVLASFSIGGVFGLLGFGALASRYPPRWLLLSSLLVFAVLSIAAAQVDGIWALIALRFFQGIASSAAQVIAPGVIRALFSEQGALRAIGVLGSFESLAPALAPIAGVWLLKAFGWNASFYTLCLTAAVLLGCTLLLFRHFPTTVVASTEASDRFSYLRLLRSPVYWRYAASQALTLGGLLVFVFGAPVVITRSLGGAIEDFIIMQVSGISTFILAANAAPRLAERFGAERIILFGTTLSAAGALGILVFALLGAGDPVWLIPLFIPMNFGLGLRGPPGFYHAVLAADGDDARGAALLILLVLLFTFGGTVAVAEVIEQGLVPLAGAALLLSMSSVVVLLTLPKLNTTTTADLD